MSAFRQSWNDRIEIGEPASAVYRFDPELPKPCVHPLATPLGHLLSGFEMSDHVWHRGLWFTIKFINGTNFWEEQAPFGVQKSVSDPTCVVLDRDRVRVQHFTQWESEATGVAIDERRQITFAPGVIDWSCELRAKADLTLDRTPYTTWGGYGGLTLRGAPDWTDTTIRLDDGVERERTLGEPSRWLAIDGVAHRGLDAPAPAGVVILDHSDNPRFPTPWYASNRADTYGEGWANFVNAALLWDEPLTVEPHAPLTLRYRVLVHDGAWGADRIADEYGRWTT